MKLKMLKRYCITATILSASIYSSIVVWYLNQALHMKVLFIHILGLLLGQKSQFYCRSGPTFQKKGAFFQEVSSEIDDYMIIGQNMEGPLVMKSGAFREKKE